jgi:hypothetical protein
MPTITDQGTATVKVNIVPSFSMKDSVMTFKGEDEDLSFSFEDLKVLKSIIDSHSVRVEL